MGGGFKHALMSQQVAAAETNTEIKGEDQGLFGQQLAKKTVAECLRRRTGSCIESSHLSFGHVFGFRYVEPTSP